MPNFKDLPWSQTKKNDIDASFHPRFFVFKSWKRFENIKFRSHICVWELSSSTKKLPAHQIRNKKYKLAHQSGELIKLNCNVMILIMFLRSKIKMFTILQLNALFFLLQDCRAALFWCVKFSNAYKTAQFKVKLIDSISFTTSFHWI